MLQQKRLAFAVDERKPQRMKNLFFASVSSLAASLMLSCAPAHALPAVKIIPPAAAMAPEKKALSCEPNLRGILEKDEKVLSKKCAEGKEFVLTNRSLIIVLDGMPIIDEDGNVIQPRFSRTDMSEIFKRGLAGWEASAKACYFLTDDRALIALPNAEMGESVPEYEMPFETKGMGKGRMIYFSGALLIAPYDGMMLAMSGDAELKMRRVALQSESRDAVFHISGKKLYFGTDGIEIRIRGGEVEIIRK
jgi:hypothetical protein